jgi:hypothetical protein
MNDTLQHARSVRDAIAQNTPRMSAPIIRTLLRTAVVPFVVFVVTTLASGYARLYVDNTFQDNNLSLLTAFSTSLLILVLTWRAWQWSERRSEGWANVRGMFALLRKVVRLEDALRAAEKGNTSPLDPELNQAADEAWEACVALAHRLNVEVIL